MQYPYLDPDLFDQKGQIGGIAWCSGKWDWGAD